MKYKIQNKTQNTKQNPKPKNKTQNKNQKKTFFLSILFLFGSSVVCISVPLFYHLCIH
jgi:hypothetical protein